MAQTILLQNARLIDGITDQTRERVSILITGKRISKVELETLPTPSDAQVTGLKGKTVLSGPIDTHVHSTFMDNECLPYQDRY
jgi:imidazolonepropionase-like amidohydrolase